jgi:hypothetical protein
VLAVFTSLIHRYAVIGTWDHDDERDVSSDDEEADWVRSNDFAIVIILSVSNAWRLLFYCLLCD